MLRRPSRRSSAPRGSEGRARRSPTALPDTEPWLGRGTPNVAVTESGRSADGANEIERGHPGCGEQDHETATSPNDIARDLTIWLAARDYPRQTARRSNTDF